MTKFANRIQNGIFVGLIVSVAIAACARKSPSPTPAQMSNLSGLGVEEACLGEHLVYIINKGQKNMNIIQKWDRSHGVMYPARCEVR